MGSLQRILTSDFNYTDICSAECFSSDDYCISDCFSFCSLTCPNRLPPFPPSSPENNLPKRFIIAAIVLGITVISLVCLTVYYKFYSGYCIRRRREELDRIDEGFVDEDRGPVVDHPIWYINTVGLESSVIDSISVCRFKKGEGIVEGSDCSVCLSEFEEDERLRLLPKCGHAFHISCIDTWLRSHTNCPLCRAPIVVQNPRPGESSSGDSRGEETQVERTEEEVIEIEIEIENGGDLQDEKREEEEGIQPLRRSISLDALSAFKISQVVKENELSAPKRSGSNSSLIRLMSSSSTGRTLQIGPSTLKRSISCSGKLFLQRYSRNSSSSRRSSVLPL